MATMNLSLPDPLRLWVEAQITNGQYRNAGDYVLDLIRRDQEYQDCRETLIAALVAARPVVPASGRSSRSGTL